MSKWEGSVAKSRTKSRRRIDQSVAQSMLFDVSSSWSVGPEVDHTFRVRFHVGARFRLRVHVRAQIWVRVYFVINSDWIRDNRVWLDPGGITGKRCSQSLGIVISANLVNLRPSGSRNMFANEISERKRHKYADAMLLSNVTKTLTLTHSGVYGNGFSFFDFR